MSSIINPLIGNTGNGLSFQATQAPIQTPATTDQANEQYSNANQGLTNQAGFLQAVQAQNGLANQSQVYNQQQGIVNGTGPNPAQAMLNNTTGANVANQASLMAGQRGSSANAGLIARQAANQGANIQQQAVGQGAANQANQSLNALNNAGSIATNQANQQANATNAYSSAAQGEQANILNSIAQRNNAGVASQSNANTVNAGMSGTVAGQQGNLLSGITGAIGSAGSLFGGGASGAAGGSQSIAGGAGDSLVSDPATMLAAQGGKVQRMADGGNVNQSAPLPESDGATKLNPYQTPAAETGPQSNVGQFMAAQDSGQPMVKKSGGGGNPLAGIGSAVSGLTKEGGALNNMYQEGSKLWQGVGGLFDSGGAASTVAGGAMDAGAVAAPAIETGGEAAVLVAAKGGKATKRVDAMVSPGEQYLPPKDAKKVAAGKANPLEAGERIPGKPKFPGNDYRNDTVPKKLEEGGLVIPNEVMQSKNPHWGAMKFVQAHMAKGGLVPKLPKKAKK